MALYIKGNIGHLTLVDHAWIYLHRGRRVIESQITDRIVCMANIRNNSKGEICACVVPEKLVAVAGFSSNLKLRISDRCDFGLKVALG